MTDENVHIEELSSPNPTTDDATKDRVVSVLSSAQSQDIHELLSQTLTASTSGAIPAKDTASDWADEDFNFFLRQLRPVVTRELGTR